MTELHAPVRSTRVYALGLPVRTSPPRPHPAPTQRAVMSCSIADRGGCHWRCVEISVYAVSHGVVSKRLIGTKTDRRRINLPNTPSPAYPRASTSLLVPQRLIRYPCRSSPLRPPRSDVRTGKTRKATGRVSR